ncbi:hypothetical protein [Bradyrhizobium ottawaense]|uniref:hypothetical protein n=1 Tax=Bradyrhizobium ottawaense TaxID=931866 RepID=UPI0036F3F8EC
MGAYGAGNRRNDRGQDHQMRCHSHPKIAQDKGKWPARVSRKMIHLAIAPFAGLHFVTDRLNIDQFASVPGQPHHDMRMRTICEDVMAASRRTPDVSNK